MVESLYAHDGPLEMYSFNNFNITYLILYLENCSVFKSNLDSKCIQNVHTHSFDVHSY